MARKALGTAPANAPDTATKSYVDALDTFQGQPFESRKLMRNTVLTASTDFAVVDSIEIPAAYSLEIPATSTLEILYYLGAPGPNLNVLRSNGNAWVSAPGIDQTLPSYVSGAINRYDIRTNIYNQKATNTRRIRSGLGKAHAGKALSHHLIIGDSASNYFLGADGSGHLNMWHRVMRSVANVQYGVPIGGTGTVPAASPSNAGGASTDYLDPRWVLTSGAWVTAGGYLTVTANGAVLTFTSDTAGTTVDVAYFDNSGSFTVAIDGGTPVTPTFLGTLTMNHYTVTGLTNKIHTVVITTTSVNPTYVFACNVNQTTGLVTHNLALFGSTASIGGGANSWVDPAVTSTNYMRTQCVPVGITPDCVWIELGGNDIMSLAASNAVITGAFTQLRNQYPNSDCVIVGYYQPSVVDQGRWESFINALYGLADALDVPMLNLYDRFGGYTIALANGMMGDTVHVGAAGQRDWGFAASNLLTGS
jgi:lysophospholipase L1-like esterase